MLPILLAMLRQPELGAATEVPLPLPVKSSAITEATYKVDGGVLTVTFRNGETYTYRDVPVDVVIGFVSAGSQGAYYDRKIKGRY